MDSDLALMWQWKDAVEDFICYNIKKTQIGNGAKYLQKFVYLVDAWKVGNVIVEV